jgi:ABC-2 type transport system permease protein
MVLVSARAQGFQDAYQLGSLVVLPVMLLIFGQVSGVMVFSVLMVFLMGLVIWLLDGLLIYLGSRSFHRNRLLAA